LKLPDGSKEPSHQHNWIVIADVRADDLDSMGLVMDFRDLKAALEAVVSEFDNQQLDQLDYFARNNASAENVAKYVYDKLVPQLPDAVRLDCVSVGEEIGCWAKFFGSQNSGSGNS
jgi:6-pyruvoyltetrahydropterin/6-carboxytetrahydropterin synthase